MDGKRPSTLWLYMVRVLYGQTLPWFQELEWTECHARYAYSHRMLLPNQRQVYIAVPVDICWSYHTCPGHASKPPLAACDDSNLESPYVTCIVMPALPLSRSSTSILGMMRTVYASSIQLAMTNMSFYLCTHPSRGFGVYIVPSTFLKHDALEGSLRI